MAQPRHFYANRAEEAVVHLRTETREDFKLSISFEHGASPIIMENRHEYDPFMTALQENSIINGLSFHHGSFNEINESLLERLFGQVLPLHRSLTKIEFYHCQIAAEYVVMLAASLANRGQQLPSLQELQFFATPIDQQGVVSLSNNLLRANVPIEQLRLVHCGMDSVGCQTLFQALDGNAHLRVLNLRSNDIADISLTGVQALASSSLRVLEMLGNGLTIDALRTLVEGMRLNFSLEELYLPPVQCQVILALFEEILTKINYTLRVVYISQLSNPREQRLNDLLRLNGRVRSAHNSLENHHNNYHVPQLSLWPDILERISSKPSLLYRFVRQGNLNAFAKQMLHDPNEGLRRSRRRKRKTQRYSPSG